jgi:hypothetical protein
MHERLRKQGRGDRGWKRVHVALWTDLAAERERDVVVLQTRQTRTVGCTIRYRTAVAVEAEQQVGSLPLV